MNYLAVLIVTVGFFSSYWFGYTPLIIPVIYIVASLLTFFAYAVDKSAAQRGVWRIPEKTLHTLSFIGGWPGAMLAQQVFRHKTKKAGFRIGFWITVLINGGVLIWLHVNQGANYLNTYTFKLEALVMNHLSSNYFRSILLSLLSFHA